MENRNKALPKIAIAVALIFIVAYIIQSIGSNSNKYTVLLSDGYNETTIKNIDANITKNNEVVLAGIKIEDASYVINNGTLEVKTEKYEDIIKSLKKKGYKVVK